MTVIIAGGGTGGHLFPGIAVAEELSARGHAVHFVGTARGLEAKVCPKAGFPLELIEVSGLKRVGIAGLLRGFARLPRALLEAFAILRRIAPKVVVGVGGYASGPLLLAARLRGLPTIVLEQNSVPGVTNRILGRLASRVVYTFARSDRFFPKRTRIRLGNPVRKQLAAKAGAAGGGAILILGGSQGARALNEKIPKALGATFAELSKLSELSQVSVRPEVIHQTGTMDCDSVRARYAELGIAAEVEPFIEDMAKAYARADVVICRAGATTIAELGVMAKPAIFIPLPTAADDHQTKNAEELVDRGAALLFREGDLDPSRLGQAIADLLRDAERRRAMATHMRESGFPDAAARIVDELERLSKGHGDKA